MPARKRQLSSSLTMYVVVALLLLVIFVFVIAFVIAMQELAQEPPQGAVAYAAEVDALMEGGDVESGERLLEIYACNICHVQGADQIAPPFTGLLEVAGERRTPLSAAEYIYESIVKPDAFIVDGYANVMPQNFGSRLNSGELGDILVYLLSGRADLSTGK